MNTKTINKQKRKNTPDLRNQQPKINKERHQMLQRPREIIKGKQKEPRTQSPNHTQKTQTNFLHARPTPRIPDSKTYPAQIENSNPHRPFLQKIPSKPQNSRTLPRPNDLSHLAYGGHKRLATTDGMKSNCDDTPPPGMTHAQKMGIPNTPPPGMTHVKMGILAERPRKSWNDAQSKRLRGALLASIPIFT